MTDAGKDEEYAGKKLRILYVEDDRSLAASLKLGLRRHAIELACAYTCREALQKMRSDVFDFYLIDVRPPTATDLICAGTFETDRTPIIFLTGADGEREQIRGYELGGDAYINKPFTVEGLMAVIHALIRRQQWQSGKGSERVKSGC
ncbi:MAG: response regulator transcription factor [Merdibacter sp.]